MKYTQLNPQRLYEIASEILSHRGTLAQKQMVEEAGLIEYESDCDSSRMVPTQKYIDLMDKFEGTR